MSSPQRSTGGVINFGYSGGMIRSNLCVSTWSNISHIAQLLDMKWFFGTACRYPHDVIVTAVVPDFGFEMFGPKITQFGACVLFVHRSSKVPVQHLPQLAESHRTCWALVGSSVIAGGFSVPPRRHGINEELRRNTVRQIFKEYDEAVIFIRGSSSGGSVFIAGDANPNDDIDQFFEAELRRRGLSSAIEDDISTHVRGRALDKVCVDARNYVENIEVHQGPSNDDAASRETSVPSWNEILGSNDIDHYPISWEVVLETSVVQQVPTLAFSKDVDEWTTALVVYADPALGIMAAELASHNDSTHLSLAPAPAGRLVGAVAVVWRTIMLISAIAGNLVTIRGDGNPGKHGASRTAAAAFRSLCEAARGVPSSIETRQALDRARAEWHRAKREDAEQHRAQTQLQLLELAGRRPAKAAWGPWK